MAEFLDRAHELRADTNAHYNCAQAVLIPFAEHAGFTLEQANAVAQAFGGGMQTGSTCGAVTGALMALGVLGLADHRTVVSLIRRVRENHDGTIACADLLRKNAAAGGQKKPHCDAMVYEAVALVEELLREKSDR
ncbi:MAG: C_GCAxxG_C_C family protein [Atopobiaceae bacterium]|nr:C_GCAxxG_C_C family protein [Atopobiaceae bacterium]